MKSWRFFSLIRIDTWMLLQFNPNSAGRGWLWRFGLFFYFCHYLLANKALLTLTERGSCMFLGEGGWIGPNLLVLQESMWKPKIDIPKVYIELVKVKKLETSSTTFSWRNGCFKKVLAESVPPTPLGLITCTINNQPQSCSF